MGWKDQDILALCHAREPQAIAAMAETYGAYCHQVAHNILGDTSDAEECVNDAYLAVWNAIPGAGPEHRPQASGAQPGPKAGQPAERAAG